MRILSAVLSLMVALALCANVHAQGEREALVVTIQDIDLTDAQEAKIGEIRKDFGPKVEKAAKEFATLVKDELEKMQAALTPEQKEKLRAMKDERRERRFEGLCERLAHLKQLHLTEAEMAKIQDIRKECHPKVLTALKELEGLLSGAQKQARQQALKSGKSRKEVLQALQLTDEQKQKVAAVAKELGTLVQGELAKIRDVLTEAQKEQLAALKDERRERVRDHIAHRIMNLRELNLTDAQVSTLTKIREESRPRIHEAANNLRAIAREEVTEILGVIKR
jgi:Spy/CpxP family protein refolding chaperone